MCEWTECVQFFVCILDWLSFCAHNYVKILQARSETQILLVVDGWLLFDWVFIMLAIIDSATRKFL